MKHIILWFSIPVLFSQKSFAQDTLIFQTNYKYKLGIKLISERSSDYSLGRNTFHVYSGGVQIIRRIKKTQSSFETGIYFNTKAKEYGADLPTTSFYPYRTWITFPVYYHYLSIPINYRLDTRSIYFSGGLSADYLLYHSTEYDYLIEYIYNYEPDRKFNIGFNFTLGIEKNITTSMSIFVEARGAFTVSWPKTNGGLFLNSGNIKPTYSNFGAGVGINYKLQGKSGKTIS